MSLVNRYVERSDVVMSFLLWKTGGDKYLSDDIFQDTFFKIHKAEKQGKYYDEDKFDSWIVFVARNCLMDYYRKNGRRQEDNLIDNPNVNLEYFTKDYQLAGIEFDDIILKKINTAVSRLSDVQKDMIRMRLTQDMSFKEIVDEEDIKLGTALARMAYALKNIRKAISE